MTHRRPLASPLFRALLIYLLLVIPLSYIQRNHVNADFIGYATITHRLLLHPASSISGHWSPLFSWLLAPLIYLHIPDLIAGRIILILAGLLFVAAIHRLTHYFCTNDPRLDKLLISAMLACSVIQALCWAIYLLDPDILAAALFFAYAAFLLHPQFAHRTKYPLLAALAAALGYLAKAYLLPFTLLHFPLTIFLRRRDASLRRWLMSSLVFSITFALLCAPWIAILSHHFHRFTLSTAGSSNHANVSPENDGFDKLFAPGLVPDYILDPHLGPDWSPFQDWAHFRYQLAIFARNLNILLGHFAPWFILLMLALAVRLFFTRPRSRSPNQSAILWTLLTFILYCSGYSLLVVEARYVLPVGAPLLCLASLLLILPLIPASIPYPRPLTPNCVVVLIVLLFSCQQIQRLINSIVYHTQTRSMTQLKPIAAELLSVVPDPEPLACNHWHDGLAIAYQCDRLPTYYGSPITPDIPAELSRAHIRVYLRLIEPETPTAPLAYPDIFIPPPPWHLTASIHDVTLLPWSAEIYTLESPNP